MIEFAALAALDASHLRRLAEVIEAGFLAPPFTKLGLREHVPAAQAESVVACLEEIAKQQDQPDQIGLVLRAFAAGSAVERDIAGSIELVVSGPDPLAAARDTGVVVRQLFRNARKRVLAVGFAVHQGREVFAELGKRLDDDSGLEATLCIDVRREPTNTSATSQIVEAFARNFAEREWPGTQLPRLYFDPRSLEPGTDHRSALHAKCIVVDGEQALVTSANFTAAAQERNIELGVLIDSRSVAQRIERHFLALIENENLERLPLQSHRA